MTRCDEGWSGCTRNHRAEAAARQSPRPKIDGGTVVTQAWLEANRTKRGGWNAKQLAILGIPWPPRQGWRRRVDGLILTPAQVARFRSLR